MQVLAENSLAMPQRANVLGIGVHAVDMIQSVRMIQDAIENGERGYVCLSGVHGIMEAYRDPVLHAIVNRALLVAPDGMPTVWLGWLQGLRDMRRVFGPSLMLELCRSSVATRYTHFLYGGNPGVARKLKRNLEQMFPGIRIVGTYTPPFRRLNRSEERELKGTFAKLRPDITWVGLSTPKQDHFMAEYISKLDTKVMIGVGAAFDIHTGRLRDCPAWMKPAGLQWLHRLWQEPSRLWRRYLVCNPQFVFHVALQLTRLRTYDVSPPPQDASIRGAAPHDIVQFSAHAAVPDFEQRAS